MDNKTNITEAHQQILNEYLPYTTLREASIALGYEVKELAKYRKTHDLPFKTLLYDRFDILSVLNTGEPEATFTGLKIKRHHKPVTPKEIEFITENAPFKTRDELAFLVGRTTRALNKIMERNGILSKDAESNFFEDCGMYTTRQICDLLNIDRVKFYADKRQGRIDAYMRESKKLDEVNLSIGELVDYFRPKSRFGEVFSLGGFFDRLPTEVRHAYEVTFPVSKVRYFVKDYVRNKNSVPVKGIRTFFKITGARALVFTEESLRGYVKTEFPHKHLDCIMCDDSVVGDIICSRCG